MAIRLFLAFFLLGSASRAQPADTFCSVYKQDCAKALAFFKHHAPLFDSLAQAYGHADSRFLLAIVAPEVAHFNTLRNQIETASSEVFYVQLGGTYGDFSVGIMQMKPSFAEYLERAADSLGLEACRAALRYGMAEASACRSERLRRMKDFRYQFIYLCVFAHVVARTYPAWQHAEASERLAYYAAAYNLGWQQGEKAILAWLPKRAFPRLGARQFAYAQTATLFYAQLQEK